MQRLVHVLLSLVATALVVPTLALTIARLLPDGNLTWVILRASAPLAIIPYGLAVIVLVAETWRLSGTARSVAGSALILVGTLLFMHLWWFTGPFLAHADGSPSEDTFVVMTANLHIGRADADAILDIVDSESVDVLVLEEVTPLALAELIASGLDQRLKYSAGEAEYGRDGILVLSNEPLREIDQISSATPGYDVEMTTNRGSLHILAVHPTAPNNGVAQWSYDLDAALASAQASKGPTLVAGDFNATLDHPQLRKLMDSGYRDASTDAGLSWRPTWPSPGNVRRNGFRIPSLFALDHVFMRGPLETRYAKTVIVPGTDHRALVTGISWVK